MINEGALYDIMREALWTSVVMSAPILAVALVAGVIIGLLQALTSVQEMTLTFVPKIGAVLIVFWLSMGMMTTTIISFFTISIIPMIEMR